MCAASLNACEERHFQCGMEKTPARTHTLHAPRCAKTFVSAAENLVEEKSVLDCRRISRKLQHPKWRSTRRSNKNKFPNATCAFFNENACVLGLVFKNKFNNFTILQDDDDDGCCGDLMCLCTQTHSRFSAATHTTHT